VPGTIVQGNVSTEEVLGPSAVTAVEGEKVIEMDEKIRKLRPDDSQFSTMSDRIDHRTTTREKFNWLEEDDFPRIVTTTTAQISTDTTLVLTAGQGKIVAGNDILRNMRSGEAIRVASVATDTCTIVRAINNNPAAGAINVGDQFLVVADAQPQGSDFPGPRYLGRVLGYNFTQITRTSWSFTGTQTSIEMYGGREPGKEAVRKAREHKRKWEAIGFFGARSFQAAAAPENEPRGTAGGAQEFITSGADQAGPLTAGAFEQIMMTVLPYGDPNSKVLFCAPLVAQNISGWVLKGMGAVWKPEPTNVYGVQVDGWISGVYGNRVPVVVKKEWQEFYSATNPKGYASYGWIIDMSLVSQVPMRDRDTKLLTEQQPKGKDVYSAEYFREATYEFAQPPAHTKFWGVTAATY